MVGQLSPCEGTGITTAENETIVRTKWVSQTLLLPVIHSPSLAFTSQKRKIATLETSEGCMPRIRKRMLLKHFFQAETDVVPCYCLQY